MWIWEEIIKILVFGVYIFSVLVIGYLAKEYFLPFSKIKKEANIPGAPAPTKKKSWLWSGVIIALAFSTIFLGIASAVSETYKILPWVYLKFLVYYFFFFVFLHIIYWIGKLILGDKLHV